MRTVTYSLYQDLHHLEQHGLYLSVKGTKAGINATQKQNIFSQIFILNEQDNVIKNGGEKRGKGRDEDSFFLIGLKTDLFCKEEPITCGKHVPGLSSMTAGFQHFQHLCKAMNDSWFK